MQQECSAIYGNYTLDMTCLWDLQPFGVEGVAFFYATHVLQATGKLSIVKLLKLVTNCLLNIRGDKNGG